MAFPALVPSSRTFDPGDFRNTAHKANSGAEFRILYGSKRTGMKMSLTYQNITDAEAQQFIDHFHSMKGTFEQFEMSDALSNAKGGWEGRADTIGTVQWGSQWRYEKPPQLKSVYPGVSTVTVNLIGATIN
jgi:hypothetical protein